MGLPLAPAPFAWLTLAAALGAIAIGIPAATRVERESGREDPGYVVIDEVAGQWITLIHSRVDLSHLLAGFLFFRLFDIVKPWPARQLEGLPAGWGIMLDAVSYTHLVAQEQLPFRFFHLRDRAADHALDGLLAPIEGTLHRLDLHQVRPICFHPPCLLYTSRCV